MPSTTRRRFLQQSALAAAALNLPRPATAATVTPSALRPLPLGAIRPTGWLLRQMQIQASGLSGHLGETWPDVGPNSGWLGGTGESWERGPYYLDGLIPLAWQLNDPKLKSIAQPFIDWTLTHQQPNGMIGPASNNDWWPRMVMLKALTQYHEATADPRVLPLMTRYFAHQLQELPSRPLQDWGKFRWQDNALSVLWLYQRQPDPSLLQLVRLLHQQGWDWQQQFARFTTTEPVTRELIKATDKTTKGDFSLSTHGVNNGQAIKAAPVWSLVSGVPEDRAGIYTMLAALDRYHGLPNGMFSCDEHLAGRNPSQGSELCTVVEAMFSLEQSIAILGDPTLADRLERLAFNALPGAFSPDMWAHQYNQEPNQVECSLHKKPWTTDGPESNLYGLAPHFGCCTANYHQGWPKFTSSLFMQIPADAVTGASEGLAAIAYAPCTVHTKIRNTSVECIQTSDYPFRNTIRLTVNPAHPIAFPLHLRIPSWATNAELRINGLPQPKPTSATFARLHRTWTKGDTIDITFPQTPILVPGFNNSVSVERGPLVFSLPIGESWVKLRDQHLTADWQVFPTTPWNYA
ncbi:MAG: beta-L-arabinofuranosidase domain-containing protein, partial [Acidobacteriota bacterium]